MPAIVQINFDFHETRAELEAGSIAVADKFLQVDGLRWKVWLVDEVSATAGGMYLFETRALAQAYADGPLVAHLESVRQNVSVSVFDTMDAAGKITRAPV